LTVVTLDRRSDRPPYRQIADHLRADIAEGRLGPGDKLPSERELAEHYDVERATAHRAVQELHLEGRVVAQAGRGVFVRSKTPLQWITRNPLTGRTLVGVVSDEQLGLGLKPGFITQLSPMPAPDELARRLGLEPGAQLPALGWRLMTEDSTDVVQDATTFFSPAVLERIPLLDADFEIGPGVYEALEGAGYVLDVEDLVSAEMPEPGEVELFDLDAGVPILVVTRITTDATTGDVLEFTQMRLPANRSQLRYLV